MQEGRCERLCILALPADLGVADLCVFVGGYLPRVREMRMVRREDGRALCLVLLRFDSQASADGFYADFNNRPVGLPRSASVLLLLGLKTLLQTACACAQFSSLEPDVVCRLVFVKDVAVSSNSAPPLAPGGQTELPTCPVCLERLDEHISGVVTTVRCCCHLLLAMKRRRALLAPC